MTPKVLVLTGYGINCDMETQHAFRLAGADAERVHLTDLTNGTRKLLSSTFLHFPEASHSVMISPQVKSWLT